MEKQTWLANIYQSLDNKKGRFHPSDFRFYNIAHLPLIANKTAKHSENCLICKENIGLLEKLVDELPESLNDKDSKRKFEMNKDKIVSHLKKEHKLRFANYFASLYTLVGTLTGVLLWFILTKLFPGKTSDTLFIFIVIGMILGYLTGKIKDKRKYRQNQQI